MTTATTPAAGEAVTPAQTTTPATPSTETTQTTQTSDPQVAETPSEAGAETPEAEEPKARKRSAAERIQQLSRRAKDAEGRERAARAEIARLRKPIAANVDNLDYDQRERLRMREALREERLETAEQHVTHARDDAVEATHETIFAKIEEAADRFPDLMDKIVAINLSQDTVDYLAGSEKGADLAHHLATNPGVADKLHRLTDPRTATRSSLRDADRLMAQLEASIAKPQPRKATTAPNPGSTLNGGTPPAAAALADLAKSENPADYIAQRRATWAKGGH